MLACASGHLLACRAVTVPELTSEIIERSGPQARLLVLLHGYGEPVDDLPRRLDRIDPDARFLAVVPTAPFERKGKAIWHRALSAPGEAARQYLASMAALDRHLGELEASTGRPAAEAVVGGFSQGGGLAIGLLLGADIAHRPAAGFGVCSFPPHVEGFRFDRAAATGRPYLLSSARRDHFAPIESSRASAASMVAAGLAVTYREVEGDHVMTDEAADEIGAWLADPASARTPPAQPLLAGIEPSPRLMAQWVEVR